MKRLVSSLFVPMLITLVISPSSGNAEGALAVAQPPDIVKQGFHFGTSWNYPTKEEAASHALERCRRAESETLRSLCKVVRFFKHECAIVAQDPESGTPGVGWAVEATREKAEAKALAECRATAGSGRQSFCEVASKGGCDTK